MLMASVATLSLMRRSCLCRTDPDSISESASAASCAFAETKQVVYCIFVMSAAIAKEETLIIETPERVPLHFALASIGNRFLACAFDHALQTLAYLLLYVVVVNVVNGLSFSGLSSAPKWIVALFFIVSFIIWM